MTQEKHLTTAQAAVTLNVSIQSLGVYISQGKITGSLKANWVDADSLTAYRQRITPRWAEMKAVLDADDGLSDEQRGFDPRQLPVRLPRAGLVDRERDIFISLTNLENTKKIAAQWSITTVRVWAIVNNAIKRLQP